MRAPLGGNVFRGLAMKKQPFCVGVSLDGGQFGARFLVERNQSCAHRMSLLR